MLQHGWIDAAIPQVYRTESSSASSYNGWCDRSYSCWQYSRKIFIGLGAYLNPKADTVTQLQYAYNDGLNGCATYSYAVPSTDGGDWWGYAAANIYTNTTTVPAMPWRDPATAINGMMWGRVQDSQTGLYVDDATVTVTGGPTVKTDANGYYVATLISAASGGTVHSTTASKSGATSQTIATATVLPGDIVRYDFMLNASTPPSITTQPQSQTVTQGLNAAFSVAASGSTPLSYQWKLNSATISGATASSYTRSNVQPRDAGSYSVVVSNSAGSATSSDAILTVTVPPTPPNITSQPQNQTVNQGASATFTVAANGSTPLYYQWSFYGTNLAGATGSSYTRANVQPADAGPYSVVITNTLGTATSSNALLTVIVPPTITTQPQSQTVNQGNNVTFNVSATGTAPLFYQWRFCSTNLAGATATSFALTSVTTNQAGPYTAVVTNAYGAATSQVASLTVTPTFQAAGLTQL